MENAHFRIDNGDGTFTVEIPDGFDRNHPVMLSYIWHINPDIDTCIRNIILEFEITGTIPPNDGDLFGYERGYFAGIYDLTELPMDTFPAREDEENPDAPQETPVDKETILRYPEFSVDLGRYTTKEGTRVTVTVPYEQFRGGARELVVQFLPGASFTPPGAHLETSQPIEAALLASLTSPSENVSAFEHTTFYRDHWQGPLPIEFFDNNEMSPQDVDYFMRHIIQVEDFEDDKVPPQAFKQYICDRLHKEDWLTDFVDEETLFNDDYSINMPITDFSRLYGDEDIGPYGIIPEGLPVLLFSYHENRIGKRTAIFIVEHMVDERGLIKGVWDSQNHVLVDTSWEPASLPVVEALGAYLSGEIMMPLWQAVIDHEVVSVNDTWYYAPRGIDENGAMELSLWDFNGSVIDFTKQNSEFPEEEGVKLLQGYANSLELLIEAQEGNPTHLPPEKFTVYFETDGSHRVVSGSEFWVDTSYLFMQTLNYGRNLNSNAPYIGQRMSEGETFENLMDWIAASDKPDYRAEKYLEATNLAFDFETLFRILAAQYKSLYYIYSFERRQGYETAFAPGYDVHSGEPLFLEPLDPTAEGRGTAWDVFQQRYGTPRHLINQAFLSGFANDNAMTYTAMQGVSISMTIFRENVLPEDAWELRNLYKGLDYFIFLERNGLQISNDGGYLARGYGAHPWPSESADRYSFGWAESFSWREDLEEFMQRKLIENGLTPEDVAPVEP